MGWDDHLYVGHLKGGKHGVGYAMRGHGHMGVLCTTLGQRRVREE